MAVQKINTLKIKLYFLLNNFNNQTIIVYNALTSNINQISS